ncbi:MAG: hypothetical protein ACRDH9_08170 [Actinomycetota bacterium]
MPTQKIFEEETSVTPVNRLLLCVVAALVLFSGGVVLVGAGHGSQSGDVPEGAFEDLTHLNKKLGNLLKDLKAGKLDRGEYIREINSIERAKHEMVDSYFGTEKVFGLPFKDVYLDLERIDVLLWRGAVLLCLDHQEAAERKTEDAKKAKDRLETRLRGVDTDPSPSPSPSPSPPWGLGLFGTWYHHGPGESSLFGCVTTDPAQGGAPYDYSVTKPDNSTSSQSGNLDGSGKATISTSINQYGTYKQTVSVTSGGVTQAKTVETNVTSSQGQNGCP